MATTLSRMISKKTASSVILRANRTINPYRNYNTEIFSTPLKTTIGTTSNSTTNLFRVPTHHRFSDLAETRSNTDESILSLIESETECAEKTFRKVGEPPKEFPFKMVDKPGEGHVTLTRKYQGEKIEAEIYEPDDPVEEKEPYVHLNVRVTKKSGLTLKFGVDARVADGITTITYLEKYPNGFNFYYKTYYHKRPYLWDLDENLQKVLKKAFHKYLEVRGFEPSNTKFLCDYMVQRKHMKCTTFLQDLKDFIAY